MSEDQNSAVDALPIDGGEKDPLQRHQPNQPPPVYSSAELLKGRREVWIEHGDQMYRLRLTSSGKLYLTK